MNAQKTMQDYAAEVIAILKGDGSCEWMQPRIVEESTRYIAIECNGTTIHILGPGHYHWRFYAEKTLADAPRMREVLARCSRACNLNVTMR